MTAALGTRARADMARQPDVLANVVAANAAALERAHTLLRRAQVRRLAALGSSRHAAGYGADALDVVGGMPSVLLAASGAAVPLPRLGSEDVLIAVSQSGATPALVDTAAHGRAHGASIVAVVNDVSSPLAQCADVVLDCAAGAESVVAATASVTAQMLLLRALASPLEPTQTAALAEVAATILSRRPAPVATPRHVVAAGFAAAWVADEVALKLAEMAGALASAESLVDHLHGPVAVPAPTVALLEPGDPNATRLAGADHVYSVGPSADYDFAIPAVGDVTLDAIARVIAGQCLAWEVAVAAGTDPDEPRGLSKVTVSR